MVLTMNFFYILNLLWISLSAFRFHHSTFHKCILQCVICTWTVAFSYEISSPVKEEYILKSQKVIEAVPRVLQRSQSVHLTSSLVNEPQCNAPSSYAGRCSEKQGYEAVRILHRQLDDDASGDIDVSESDEFIRDELNYENGYERHREFHGNDKYISVDELWQSWKVSEVHNWTVDQTVEWLLTSVELPQYEHNFRNNGVDGTCLPRLAINSNSYMAFELGIRDAIHRHKISVKAMDVVLFGRPKHHNYLKDALLGLSLVIAVGGIWFAYVQHKYSQNHMQKMMKDMEVLQKAEDALLDLQQELNKAKQEQEIVNIEKQDLERRLQDEMSISKLHGSQDSSSGDGTDQSRVVELERQLRSARSNLHEAEKRLEARAWVAPPGLQHWLQLTHELELKNYNAKKGIAEQQLQSAKEGCEKLRRKRSTFMGAFRIAHGGSIDDVDDHIIQAKAALCELTSDLQERMSRWKQIEQLCGFPIVHNRGIGYLESVLRPSGANGTLSSLHSGLSSATRNSSDSEGTLHEESPPPYPATSSAGTLVSIPPPSYSASTPVYPKKISTTNQPEKLVYSSIKPSSNVKAYSNMPHLDNIEHNDYSQILETADEDEHIYDLDDDCTERSVTPPSCSSYSGLSDTNKPQFSISDNLSDQDAGVKPLQEIKGVTGHSRQSSQDKVSTCSEELPADTVLNTSDNKKKVGSAIRKISETVLDRKKKSVNIVSALRSSMSSTSLNEHVNLPSDSTSNHSEGKHKKKKFFPQLLRRKNKML